MSAIACLAAVLFVERANQRWRATRRMRNASTVSSDTVCVRFHSFFLFSPNKRQLRRPKRHKIYITLQSKSPAFCYPTAVKKELIFSHIGGLNLSLRPRFKRKNFRYNLHSEATISCHHEMDVPITPERFNVNVSLQSSSKSLQALLYVYNKGKDRRCCNQPG